MAGHGRVLHHHGVMGAMKLHSIILIGGEPVNIRSVALLSDNVPRTGGTITGGRQCELVSVHNCRYIFSAILFCDLIAQSKDNNQPEQLAGIVYQIQSKDCVLKMDKKKARRL